MRDIIPTVADAYAKSCQLNFRWRNNLTRMGFVFKFGLVLLMTFAIALKSFAHQPYCEFADLTAAAPWQVPDASISYAYFGNVYPADDIDYFAFEAAAGHSVLLSLSIPAIPEQEVFAPIMAVFGPGLDSDPRAEHPSHNVQFEGQSGMMIPLGEEPVYWFEPFGRKYYWNWDDYNFKASQTATYTVALWHPHNEIGRYSFVIGQREVFGGEADCIYSYGDYWTPLEAGVNPYRDTVITAETMADTMHDHSAMLEMDIEDAPYVDLQLIPLADGSYNVRVQTLNFVFTPQHVDMAPLPGEGHAHLYIDGVKIARVYGEWYHLAALPEGAEVVSVTLYANDHSAFTVDGEPVAASVTLSTESQGHEK